MRSGMPHRRGDPRAACGILWLDGRNSTQASAVGGNETMALATKPPAPQPPTARRVWKAPLTKTWWYWLLGSVILYGGVFAWYFSVTRPPNDQIGPADPSATGRTLLSIGIIAFLMVLGVAAFSLRSRFMRNLPGKAQSWLWMHTWLSVVAVFV